MFIPVGDNIERRILPVVPIVLIFVNVLVFAVELRVLNSEPRGEEAFMDFLHAWGLVPLALAEGQVVGLLSYMFLHGDFMHILGNMIVLWAFACSLEAGLGRWTFLGFYLLFGFVAGLAHAAMDLSSEAPLIGASGAVAGLIGAYTVLYGPASRIRTIIFFFYRPFQVHIPASAFGLGWFGLQLLNASFDTEGVGGVAWYCHIGGFLMGVVVAFLCRGETKCQLKADKDGSLVLDDSDGARQRATAQLAPSEEGSGLPALCPYCRQKLGEQDRIAFNLARCGNASCARLIYADAGHTAAAVGAE
jgi:membrane associated rhomboid family serine protease